MENKKPELHLKVIDSIGDLELGRGEIKKAMGMNKLYRAKVEKANKDKGSYQRNIKHKGKEPYSKVA